MWVLTVGDAVNDCFVLVLKESTAVGVRADICCESTVVGV
jgi:hypothetical protein